MFRAIQKKNSVNLAYELTEAFFYHKDPRGYNNDNFSIVYLVISVVNLTANYLIGR